MRVIVCLQSMTDGAAPSIARDDAHALAHALALTNQNPAAGPTALLAGTPQEAGPLLHAVTAGASRAVRIVSDEKLAGADFHTLGQVFAAGIKSLGADLILAGARSDEEGLGAAAASTARQLGFVYLSTVEEISISPRDGGDEVAFVEAVVRGGGRKRRLRVTLPAVLSVVAGPRPGSPPPPRSGPPPEVETLLLLDPDRTVVRRRTDLLGSQEPAARAPQIVTSSTALVTALTKPRV